MGLAYFISDDGESVISLDCEQEINLSKSVNVTESSVMSGKTVSDGYREMNKVLQISGKVTYSKSANQLIDGNLDPFEIQEALDSSIRNHHRFKVYTDENDSNIPLLKSIEQCVIQQYTVTLSRYVNAIDINMTIKEVFVSKSAKVGYLENIPNEDAAKTGSDPEKVRSGKQEEAEDTNNTMFKDWSEGKGLASIFSGGSGGN